MPGMSTTTRCHRNMWMGVSSISLGMIRGSRRCRLVLFRSPTLTSLCGETSPTPAVSKWKSIEPLGWCLTQDTRTAPIYGASVLWHSLQIAAYAAAKPFFILFFF